VIVSSSRLQEGQCVSIPGASRWTLVESGYYPSLELLRRRIDPMLCPYRKRVLIALVKNYFVLENVSDSGMSRREKRETQ
jgi:hypothetical protein